MTEEVAKSCDTLRYMRVSHLAAEEKREKEKRRPFLVAAFSQ
jgi:hypothetical protein